MPIFQPDIRSVFTDLRRYSPIYDQFPPISPRGFSFWLKYRSIPDYPYQIPLPFPRDSARVGGLSVDLDERDLQKNRPDYSIAPLVIPFTGKLSPYLGLLRSHIAVVSSAS